jgi:uncharacterized membrane protein
MVQLSIPESVSNTLSNFTSGNTAASGFQNVGESERAISAVGGTAIALYGLNRGGFSGLLIAAIGGSLIYRGVTGNCEMYRALGVNTNPRNQFSSATGVPAQYGFKYEKNFIINRPAQELYDHWRRLENLPLIMRHLKSVTQTDLVRSHWVAKGPMNVQLEWDAEIINEEPGRMIAWRSLPGSTVDTAGSVHFDELGSGRGTQLRVSLKYNPPGGKVGASIAWLLGSGAEQEVEEDLRRFKQVMEAGEVPTTRGQSSGAGM